MRVEVQNPRWMMDTTGAWVSFQVPTPVEARGICESMKQGERYTAEIKKIRKKRSKNANDYLWELLTQMSKALAKSYLYVSKEDIYRKHIKIAGRCDYVAVPERAVDSLIEGWKDKGIGWFAEVVDFIPGKEIEGCKKVCLYYGSSTYDSLQMSRLINLIQEDCKQYGIEVMTPAELALLMDGWSS